MTATKFPETELRALEIDLNGVWNVPSDAEAVAEAHRRGRLVSLNIPILGGDDVFVADAAKAGFDLRAAASRDLFGNIAKPEWYERVQEQRDAFVLTIQHPGYREHLRHITRFAVDSGVDLLFLDEIQTSALLVSRARGGSGFSPVEIAAWERSLPRGFRAHLRDRYFPGGAVPPVLDGKDVAEVLRRRTPRYRRVQERLFAEYKDFQERDAMAHMAEFLRYVREYAARRGSKLRVGANMGLGWRAGWSRLATPILATRLDLLVTELEATAAGEDEDYRFPPAARFSPYYRLGRALVTEPLVGVPSVGWSAWLARRARAAGKTYDSLNSVLFSEAVANGGNWAVGWWDPPLRHSESFLSLAPYTRFVKAHRDWYETPKHPASVAVIYANRAVLAAPESHFAYVRLATRLEDLHLDYDVVFTGDSVFDEVPLERERLERYETILVPMSGALGERNEATLRELAQAGRTVLRAPSAAPSLRSLAEDHAIVRTVGASGIRVNATLDDERLLLHLVNPRYRETDDSVRGDARFPLRWRMPPGWAAPREVEYHRPEAESRRLLVRREGRDCVVEVPALHVYGVIGVERSRE